MSYILIGKVTGVYGIKGEVKILPYTSQPMDMLQYPSWILYLGSPSPTPQALENLGFRFSPETGQVHAGKGLRVKLATLDTPEVAKLWVNAQIYVDRNELPRKEKVYYWDDLIQLDVYTHEGIYLGKVTSLFETGANDVLVIQHQNGPEHLLPYQWDDIILSIDLEKGEMHVNWLLDSDDAL